MEQRDMSGAEVPVEQQDQKAEAEEEGSLDHFKAANRHQDSDETSFLIKAPRLLLCGYFPPVMKIYYQWNLAGLKTFHVCGNDERDRLFAVQGHSGYSVSGPLGLHRGLHLYNGPSTKDDLLAAFGQRSALPGFSISNKNVVFLRGSQPYGWTSETMRSHTTPKPDNNVAFRFGLAVGRGKHVRRETFEWKKVKKNERDDSTQNGGFKLLWLSPNSGLGGPEGGSSSQSAANESNENEVVAIFSWRKFLEHPKHPFDLTITGDAQFIKLGDRCLLMVLITSLGLWWLHAQGKTNRGLVATAEKIEGKGKSSA